MDALARSRLTEERKALAANRPVGCWARPVKSADGSVDLFTWHMGITPNEKSIFALPDGGTYRLVLKFGPSYPLKPPSVSFDPPIFHTHVWPVGTVW